MKYIKKNEKFKYKLENKCEKLFYFRVSNDL